MAPGAERLLLLSQKTGMGATMRHVTGRAVLGGGRVGNGAAETAVVMTAQTELPLGLLEHSGMVGTVRVMALRTLGGCRMLMARRELRLEPRVAPKTQVRLFGLQLESAHEPVRLVARGAVPLDQGRMGLANRAHHFRVTIEALASLLESGAPLQLCLCRLGPGDPEKDPEHNDREPAQSALTQCT
jgi:hypothetical protein